MRKITAVVGLVLMLSLTVTKAQDKVTQAPIIALADGKLYAVSAEDGSTRLLVDPGSEQTISPLRDGNISPDGKYLVYISQSLFDTAPKDYKSDLYLVTIADGTTKTISPSGGLFDVPAAKDERFVLDMATWSTDGNRIYYVRSTYSTVATNVNKPTLLAYYDVTKDKHELVARLDPKNPLDNLQSVPDGMVVRWYEPGFSGTTTSTLYAANNQIVKQVKMDIPYLYMLRDKDELYYAQLKDFGDIDFVVNAETGEKETFKAGYFPAEQSLMNGEKSMHVFSTQSDINTYFVYGADYHTFITSIDNTSGISYAIAPDGQHLAYIVYGDELKAPIQIMDMKGNVRKLDFEAEQLLWGATEYVPFYAPG
jgi:hypothetical protein